MHTCICPTAAHYTYADAQQRGESRLQCLLDSGDLRLSLPAAIVRAFVGQANTISRHIAQRNANHTLLTKELWLAIRPRFDVGTTTLKRVRKQMQR